MASPPFDWSVLAWTASLPMLLVIDRSPTLRQALFCGWWAGIVESAGGYYWLVDVMQRFAGFRMATGVLVLILFCAWRGLIFLLFTAIICGIRRRIALPMSLLAPIAMAFSEWLIPQLFPSGQYITQAWQPWVLQIAEYTGPYGITALLMMVNGACYDVATDARGTRHAVTAAGAMLAAVLLWSHVRMCTVDAAIASAPRLDVGIVQPNFAPSSDGSMSWSTAQRELTALQAETRVLADAGAQFVIWSESSYPMTLPRDRDHDYPPSSPRMIRRGSEVPVMFGAVTGNRRQSDTYNSAVLVERDGIFVGRYDKVRLLAFGEYVPFIEFPRLRDWLPANVGRFTAGTGPAMMTLATASGRTLRVTPVICYEDILPGYLRRAASLSPDLLVNLTSDGWFGAAAEPWQHLALAVFASVEFRVSTVRAANSGVSALIDPNGRVVSKTYAIDPYGDPHEADATLLHVPIVAGGRTVYARFGDLFVALCAAIICGCAAICHLPRVARTPT